jgi:hypothetical protein
VRTAEEQRNKFFSAFEIREWKPGFTLPSVLRTEISVGVAEQLSARGQCNCATLYTDWSMCLHIKYELLKSFSFVLIWSTA